MCRAGRPLKTRQARYCYRKIVDSVRVQLIQVVPTTHTPLLDWLLTGALVKNKRQYSVNII